MAAAQRYLGRQQALQARAIRAAVWADAKDLRRLLDALDGSPARDDADGEEELRKAMAAFGIDGNSPASLNAEKQTEEPSPEQDQTSAEHIEQDVSAD